MSGLCHSLATWICLLLDLRLDNAHIEIKRVGIKSGLVVREGMEAGSKELTELKEGDFVAVLCTKGDRAMIILPELGWVDTVQHGKPTLTSSNNEDSFIGKKYAKTVLARILHNEVPLKMIPVVSKFMQAIEVLASLIEELPESTSRINKCSMAESAHPYVGVASSMKRLSLSGAKTATIVFDKRCELPEDEVLQVFEDEKMTKPLSKPFTRTSMQKKRINLVCSTIYISTKRLKQKHGSSSSRDSKGKKEKVWGYKVVISGLARTRPLGWAETLAHTTSWMVGCMCAKLVVGLPSSAGEKALFKTGTIRGPSANAQDTNVSSLHGKQVNIFGKGIPMKQVKGTFPENLRKLFEEAAAFNPERSGEDGSEVTNVLEIFESEGETGVDLTEREFIRDLLAPDKPVGLAKAFMESMYDLHKDPFRFMIKRVREDSRAVFRAVLAVLLWHTGRITQARLIAKDYAKVSDEGLDHPPLLRRTSSATPASIGILRIWRAAQSSSQKISMLVGVGKDHRPYMYTLLERARLLLHVQPAFARAQRVSQAELQRTNSSERKGGGAASKRNRDISKLRGLLKLQQNRLGSKGQKPEDLIVQALLIFLRPAEEQQSSSNSETDKKEEKSEKEYSNRSDVLVQMIGSLSYSSSFKHDPQCSMLWEGLIHQHTRALMLLAGLRMFRIALGMVKKPSLHVQILHHLINADGMKLTPARALNLKTKTPITSDPSTNAKEAEDSEGVAKSNQLLDKLPATNDRLRSQLMEEYSGIVNDVTSRCLVEFPSPAFSPVIDEKSLWPAANSSDEKEAKDTKTESKTKEKDSREKKEKIRENMDNKSSQKQGSVSLEARLPLWTLKLYEMGLYNMNILLSDADLLSKTRFIRSVNPLLRLPTATTRGTQRHPTADVAATETLPWNLRYAAWLLFQTVAYSTFSHAHAMSEKNPSMLRLAAASHTTSSSAQEEKKCNGVASHGDSIKQIQDFQKELMGAILVHMQHLVRHKSANMKASRVRAQRLAKRGRAERKHTVEEDSSVGRIGPANVGFKTVYSEGSTGIEYTQVASGVVGFYSTVAKVEAPKGDSCWNAIANVCVTRGRWYYEVRFLTAPAGGTGAPCYIGWSGKDFTAANNTTGCGDTDNSWSFSPFGPGPSWHRGNQKRYPITSNAPRAKVGSILGCEIVINDRQMGEIVWYMDGVCLGVAYTGFKIPTGGISPAAGLLKGEVEFLFHRDLLKHLPTNANPFEDTRKIPKLDLFSRMANVQDVGDFEWHERSREMHVCDAATTWYRHALNDAGYMGPAPLRENPPSTGEVELFMTQFLFMVLRCSRFPYVQQLIQSQEWVNMLFDVIRGAASTSRQTTSPTSLLTDSRTPMSTTLVLKLLRIVLPQLPPDHIALKSFRWAGDKNKEDISSSSSASKSSSRSGCSSVVSFFLSEIGAACHEWYVSEAVVTDEESPSNDVKVEKNGQKVVATDEYICLCRVLLDSPRWNAFINAELLRALNGLDAVAKTFEWIGGVARKQQTQQEQERKEKKRKENKSVESAEGSQSSSARWHELMKELQERIQPIFAALSVLGGHVESIREGSRVLAPTSDDELVLGTVSKMWITKRSKDSGNGNKDVYVSVHLDTGNITKLPSWKLTPAPGISLTARSAEQQPKIMDLIMGFLSQPIPDFASRTKILRSDTEPSRILSLQLVHTQLRRRCLGVIFELLRIPKNVHLFVERKYPLILRKLAMPSGRGPSSQALERGTVPISSSSLSILRGRVLFLEQRLAQLSTSASNMDISVVYGAKDVAKTPELLYTCPPDAMYLVGTKSEHFVEVKASQGSAFVLSSRVPRNHYCSSANLISTAVSQSRKMRPKPIDSSEGAIEIGVEKCKLSSIVHEAREGITAEFQFKLDPKRLAKEEVFSPRQGDEKKDMKPVSKVLVEISGLNSKGTGTMTGSASRNGDGVIAGPAVRKAGCRLEIVEPETTTFALNACDGNGNEVRKLFNVSLKEKRKMGGNDVLRFRCKSSKFYLAYISEKDPLRLAEMHDQGCKNLVSIPSPSVAGAVQLLFDLSPGQGKDKHALRLNNSAVWEIKHQRDSFVALWNVHSNRYLQFNASKKTVSLAAAEEGKGSNISDVCLFQVEKVFREWSSIALTVSPQPQRAVTAFINGTARCTIKDLDGNLNFANVNAAGGEKATSYKIEFPGEMTHGLRAFRIWRQQLLPRQIFSLLSPRSLAYLYQTKLIQAISKRGRSVANHVFLPQRLPYSAKLIEACSQAGGDEKHKPLGVKDEKKKETKGSDATKVIAEDRSRTGKYNFDPQAFDLPLGSKIVIRDGLPPRQQAYKDYTLDLDFWPDYEPWEAAGDRKSTEEADRKGDPSGRFFKLLTVDASEEVNSACVMVDRAVGALIVQCEARQQEKKIDLTNSRVSPREWHRINLCVCPTRVLLHLDGQPVMSMTWKGWKDESGGLHSGMLVLRRKGGVGSNNGDSDNNGASDLEESEWEGGRLVSFKRQDPRWVLNVRWDNLGKEGEVAWPSSDKVRVVDLNAQRRVKPTAGLKAIVQVYADGSTPAYADHDRDTGEDRMWYHGLLSSVEEVSEGKWLLSINTIMGDHEEIKFPAEAGHTPGIVLLTPELQKLNSNEGASQLLLGSDDLDTLMQAKENYPESFATLSSMGFPEHHCCRALAATNGDREQAVEWVLQNRVTPAPRSSKKEYERPPTAKEERETMNLPLESLLLYEPALYADAKCQPPKPRAEFAPQHKGGDTKVENAGSNSGAKGEKTYSRSSSFSKRRTKSPASRVTSSTSSASSSSSASNHNFRLGKSLVLFGDQDGHSDNRTSASWTCARVKWLRIERNTNGKCEAKPCYTLRDGNQGPWNWPESGLSTVTEKQLYNALANTEGIEDLESDVIYQALVQSSYDVTDAFYFLVNEEILNVLKKIVEASKLSNAVLSLGALGYSAQQCEEALSRSGDKLQPSLLWLLDHKVPHVKIGDPGAWRLTKANGAATLYPLYTDMTTSEQPRKSRAMTHFVFNGDAADGCGNANTPLDDEIPDMAAGMTKKAWTLHLKDLEVLKRLSIHGVKMSLLHTELTFISRYGIACAMRTMQQQLKAGKRSGSEVLLMFDSLETIRSKTLKSGNGENNGKHETEQPQANAVSETAEPLFFTKLMRLVHLSRDETHLRILRNTLIRSLNDEAKSLLQNLGESEKERTLSAEKDENQRDKVPLNSISLDLRQRVPIGFAISSEYTLHMFGYIMQKLYPLDSKNRLDDAEESDDTAPRVGAKVMVASSGGGYYYKWEISSAELMDDGRWKLGVRRGASSESYIYPSPSNRIILLPSPPLTRPATGMRILGRHDAWYPGRISGCTSQPMHGRWEVHISYDDGDTDMLTYPGPASHPIILLGDAWNRTRANTSLPKNPEERLVGEFNSVKAADAVVHPSIDLALWIVEILLEFQQQHTKKSPQLLKKLQPLLFSEAVVNAMFEIIRSGGGPKGGGMRLAFVYLLTNLIRTFGHSNLLTIAQVQALRVFMLDLFLVHTTTNTLKGLTPSPLFQAMVELNLCIGRRQLLASPNDFVVEAKEKWFHQLLMTDQVLDALQPCSRTFLPSSFVESLWADITREWPNFKQLFSKSSSRRSSSISRADLPPTTTPASDIVAGEAPRSTEDVDSKEVGDKEEQGASATNTESNATDEKADGAALFKRAMGMVSAQLQKQRRKKGERSTSKADNTGAVSSGGDSADRSADSLATAKPPPPKTIPLLSAKVGSDPQTASQAQVQAQTQVQALGAQSINPRYKALYLNDAVFMLVSGADGQLVDLVRTYCEKRSLPLAALNVRDFDPTEEELLHCKKLEEIVHLDKKHLQVRLFVLQRINNMLAPLLDTLIDLSQPNSWVTVASKVRNARNLIFWSHKQKLWKKALSATHMPSSVPSVSLDRMRAVRMKEREKVDTKGLLSVFGQTFRQLRNQDCFRVSENVRAFKVFFIGEHAIDAGGPYRAAITDMCDELQSTFLPLFIPCPNSREAIGENRDKWVPNPSSRRAIYLKMYEFVGKLMGLAMRSGNLLELDFPSIVWKPLVLMKPNMQDLKSVDLICFKIIERLTAFDKMSAQVAAQQFDKFQLDFTCVLSNQKLVKLVNNGQQKKVTWNNRKLYLKLLLRERLNEFRTQCAAIRRGLASVVPASVFTLFTHQELEIAVCGSPMINVDLLQMNTAYTYPTKGSDRHVRLFWKMMREKFTQADRIKFLRFVWGRSRHPRDNESWGAEKFHIAPHSPSQNSKLSPDEYHPSAHTCFFTLELPEYSSLEIMYSKVLYAITHCTAVDGDATFNAARQIAIDDSSTDDEE
eukprot:CAMPEP_0184486476 /NCGR_PEP_ID=MMETSP0113_2-20130426/7955_1 /TAXON_ID=91329 /ORGANISM="Norrisiella sphaerica, Strain BC52" /LENGTH=4298 /DNA_ID=CAMNT_0026868373 /DNA_START=23 /DNA_END=12919 /DNA_ORIENTATION=-